MNPTKQAILLMPLFVISGANLMLNFAAVSVILLVETWLPRRAAATSAELDRPA